MDADVSTQIPLWVAVVIAVGSPLLAFLGVTLGQWAGRRGAQEAEVRWRREETMRMLRWAADLATSSEPTKSDLGVAALAGLQHSEILQPPDQELISNILDAIVEPAEDVYTGGDAVVLDEEA